MIRLSIVLSLVYGVVFIQGYAVPGGNTNVNTNINSLRRNKSAAGYPHVFHDRGRRLPRDWVPIDDGNHWQSKKLFEKMNVGYYEDYAQTIRTLALRAANVALSITRSRAEELAETVAESVAAAVGDAVAQILVHHHDNPISARRRNTNYNTNLNTNIVTHSSGKNDYARDSNGEEMNEDERAPNLGIAGMTDFEEHLGALLNAGKESNKPGYVYTKPDSNEWQIYPGSPDEVPFGYGSNLRGFDQERVNSQSFRNNEEIETVLHPSLHHIIDLPNSTENDENAVDFTQEKENAEANGRQRNVNDNSNVNQRNVNVNTNINEIANRIKQNSHYRRI